MSENITEKLASFAAGLEADAMPPDVRESVKALLLDTLACAYAGHEGEETGQVRAMAAALGTSTESSVIGGEKMSLSGATLLNGYLIAAVTMSDVHRPTLTHITPEVVPPALMIAERDGGTGADLLAALAAGFEVTTRVGVGLDYPVFRGKGWHGPGVIGPFGAAAAVGRLHGFDTETMTRAFALAGSQSAGTFAAWGTPTVKFHQCRAALSGLMAALLAEQDFVATKEFLTAADGGLYNVYAEGGLPDRAAGKLGEYWELQQIALRLWPSATGLQEVITALYNLVGANEVAFEDVEHVRLGLSTTPFRMHGGFAKYKAKFEALLSAHYVAGVFLRDRTVTLAQFEPACYDAPELRAFAANNVEIFHDEGLANGQATVAVTLKDGRTLEARCDHALGVPENPLSREQVEDKFRTYAKARIPQTNVEGIIEAASRLEDLTDARELVGLLRAG